MVTNRNESDIFATVFLKMYAPTGRRQRPRNTNEQYKKMQDLFQFDPCACDYIVEKVKQTIALRQKKGFDQPLFWPFS